MKLRRLAPITLVLGLLLILSVAGLQNAAGTEETRSMTLLDAPNGREVGWVHEPDTLEVLERRDGWKRVRLEGWISESATTAVRGHADEPQGTEVLLLRGSAESWSARAVAMRSELGPLQDEADTLRRQRGEALRMDNFSEATTRYDEINRVYKSKNNELVDKRRQLLATLTLELRAEALNRTSLDPQGNFEFYPPGPGQYGVFIPMAESPEFPCCWKDVEVDGGDLWVDLKPEEKEKKKAKKKKSRKGKN